jgi:hypothetical protein
MDLERTAASFAPAPLAPAPLVPAARERAPSEPAPAAAGCAIDPGALWRDPADEEEMAAPEQAAVSMQKPAMSTAPAAVRPRPDSRAE